MTDKIWKASYSCMVCSLCVMDWTVAF